jgi:CO/xanthine dehydrogenase FAD-binding subunit
MQAVAVPRTVDAAIDALTATPGAVPLAGGTDLMVEVNYGLRRPAGFVVLTAVDELRGWQRDNGDVVLKAGLTYAEMEHELTEVVPALAQAARTVGSPQIRNAGTLGGNLATGSPAGDTLPVLAALDAVVTVRGPNGSRELAVPDFLLGPKRTALAPGELVVSVRLPAAAGPQEFLKVGTRTAMVIAVASIALVVDRTARTVRCALGSVGPVMIRPREAEAWVGAQVDWDGAEPPDAAMCQEFGRRVAADARPIDDHRSTADYRRHAVAVCAARALGRALP